MRADNNSIDVKNSIFEKIKNDDIVNIFEIIPIVSPGNELRKSLDDILFGNLGALIILGYDEKLKEIMKGGFELNIPFSKSKLFELAKMDGAIILSSDLKTIIGANVHLMPDRTIDSDETGMRHRSAEQTAKQSSLPVIAMSHRKNIISLYYKDQKYILQDLSFLIVKANHSLNILKDYRIRIDSSMDILSYKEISNAPSVYDDVIEIIQNILYFYKHIKSLDSLVIELGTQGTEISESMYEYTSGIENRLSYLIQDYYKDPIDFETAYKKAQELRDFGVRKISDKDFLKKELGYQKDNSNEDIPRGYRVLSKIQNLDKETISQIIETKKSLLNIINSDADELSSEVGIDFSLSKYILQKLNGFSDNISDLF